MKWCLSLALDTSVGCFIIIFFNLTWACVWFWFHTLGLRTIFIYTWHISLLYGSFWPLVSFFVCFSIRWDSFTWLWGSKLRTSGCVSYFYVFFSLFNLFLYWILCGLVWLCECIYCKYVIPTGYSLNEEEKNGV